MSPMYSTAAAFRRALTDRLRATAHPRSPWPLADLQRQFAYDRLLARLYALDAGWVVKGATALIARRISHRHTIDLDVYRSIATANAEADLRQAISIDLGDWFSFEITAARPIGEGHTGTRLPLIARVGTTEWARFHVDVVADGITMTDTVDHVPALPAVTIPGLARPGYRVYPLVDHIADKICAILEHHGPLSHPSTRFKDLVDLVAITQTASVAADRQHAALQTQIQRRNLTPPHSFDIPDRPLWETGYAAEARRTRAATTNTLDDALALVKPFIDPLLDRTATGTWDPIHTAWQ